MSVRMRHTRGHTRNRRSHHALTARRLSACSSCGALHVRHQVCPSCGVYRGRAALDVASKQERSRQRKEAKERAIGEATGGGSKHEHADEVKEADAADQRALSPEQLSRKS